VDDTKEEYIARMAWQQTKADVYVLLLLVLFLLILVYFQIELRYLIIIPLFILTLAMLVVFICHSMPYGKMKYLASVRPLLESMQPERGASGRVLHSYLGVEQCRRILLGSTNIQINTWNLSFEDRQGYVRAQVDSGVYNIGRQRASTWRIFIKPDEGKTTIEIKRVFMSGNSTLKGCFAVGFVMLLPDIYNAILNGGLDHIRPVATPLIAICAFSLFYIILSNHTTKNILIGYLYDKLDIL
jgi:hypothetical protein